MLGRVRRIIWAVATFSAPLVLACATALQEPPAQEPGAGPWGYGSISKGGETDLSGLPHEVYEVTNLNDSGPGSLRDGILNRARPRVVQVKVGGTIVLQTPIKIEMPYLTIDGSMAPAPGITLQISQEGGIGVDPEVKVAATHDVIIHGLRFAGTWDPGEFTKNTATLSVDGDAGANVLPWDPNTQACGPSAAHLRNSCRIIIDQNTFSGAADSGPDFWCGVKDLTFSRNLIIDSFQFRGTGCKGVYPEGHQHARQRITEYANVYGYNGERQPKLNEGVYDYDFVNNIVFAWQDYGTVAGRGPGGYGSFWDDDGAQERHNVIGNAWLPEAGGTQGAICGSDPSDNRCRRKNDCQWGSTVKCDPRKGYPTPGCEQLLREDPLHFSDNLHSDWHNPNECISTPTGQQPMPRPYTLPVVPAVRLEIVLDAAGASHKTTRERQVIDATRAALRARVGQR